MCHPKSPALLESSPLKDRSYSDLVQQRHQKLLYLERVYSQRHDNRRRQFELILASSRRASQLDLGQFADDDQQME